MYVCMYVCMYVYIYIYIYIYNMVARRGLGVFRLYDVCFGPSQLNKGNGEGHSARLK